MFTGMLQQKEKMMTWTWFLKKKQKRCQLKNQKGPST
jgi:hypothetical protein